MTTIGHNLAGILPWAQKNRARLRGSDGVLRACPKKGEKTGVSEPSATTRTYSPTTDSVKSDQTGEAYANYPYFLQKYYIKQVLSIRRKKYKVKYSPLFS